MGWVSIASRWPVRLHGVTASGRDVFALALTGAFKGVYGKVGSAFPHSPEDNALPGHRKLPAPRKILGRPRTQLRSLGD